MKGRDEVWTAGGMWNFIPVQILAGHCKVCRVVEKARPCCLA